MFGRWMNALALAFAFYITLVAALGQNKTLTFEKTTGAIDIVSRGKGAQLTLDGNDWLGVIRAARDVASDVKKVTGHELPFKLENSTTFTFSGPTKTAIIVGTIGKSKLIDDLISRKLIDVSNTKGKWEAYVSTVVKSPFPGIDAALVIAGADKRGSIYGLYDISEQIGVSPWYWWADVPARRQSSIYALPTTKVQKSPSVKYRGIFLNDEQPALTNWVNENFPPGKYGPGYNAEFYSNVFELLLRLKANLLWPTMWDGMFGVDDPKNQWTADMYGIVMSTSHTEPLMRSTKEWNTLGNGTWDYRTNGPAIYDYWVEGVERSKNFESLYTMGMRGNGDNVLSEEVVSDLLESIVKDQREILSTVLGVDEAGLEKVPQVWCLYKDIQAYYETGLRVPDDVTLLWADDNWGNIRRLPTANETARKGGAGVYYHFDYVGDPRDYKWINTNQLQKTWEQMTLAYERHARQIWIVNVGDLKPLEIPIDYFMSLAYDIDAWGPINTVTNWIEAWAEREFGSAVAKETAEIVDLYGLYSSRRRFELVDPQTYSVIHYREADERLAEWAALVKRAQAVYDKLPHGTKPAFFELVLHPAKAGQIFYDVMIGSAKNNLRAHQRSNSANQWADFVRKRFNDDHKLMNEYHKLLGGKWNHMMDQTHFGYNYWQQPMRNTMPPVSFVQEVENSLAGSLGLTVQSSNGSVPGDDRWNVIGYNNNSLVLPTADPYGPESQFIDIFNKGTDDFEFEITPHNPWVKVSPSKGKISASSKDLQEVRVEVSVDWEKAPDGYNIAFVNVSSTASYGNFGPADFRLPINKTSVAKGFKGFPETQKQISIEAENASRMTKSGDGVHYEVIKGLGRTKSGVTLFPRLIDTQVPPASPALEFDLYLFSQPQYGANVTVYLAGGLNMDPHRQLKYAVQLGDGGDVQIKQYVPDVFPLYMPAGWEKSVADGNTWTITTTHMVAATGKQTLRLWAVEPGVVFEKVVVDLGGVKPSYLGPPPTKKLT